MPPSHLTGTILVSCRQAGLYRVRLDDGEELEARVPATTARHLFRIVPGDRVRVSFRDPKQPRIVGFVR